MRRAGPLLAQAAAVAIWSTTIVVSAGALATTSPAVLTLSRFTMAAGLLLPFALRRGSLIATLRSPVTAVLGLTGVTGYYGLQSVGLQYTTAGTAALLQAVFPVATAALAAVLLGERLRAGTGAGLVLATAGVVLVAAGGAHLDVGAGLVLLGVVSYAFYTVLLRWQEVRRDPGADPVDAVTLGAATALWGVAFLVPWQGWELASGRATLPTQAPGILAVLYLGTVGSGLTLVLWTYGASRTAASLSGVLTAAIPGLGYAVSVVAGEQLVWSRMAGGAVAVTGVLLATRAETRSAATTPARLSRPARSADG